MIHRDRRSCTLPATSADLSISNWISSTLALLEDDKTPIKIKREIFLDSIPSDDDEINQYSHDAPWDIDPDHNQTQTDPKPRIEGSESMKHAIGDLCDEFNYLFTMEVRKEPAKVESFKLTVNDDKWQARKHMSAPRPQSLQIKLKSIDK